MRNRNVNSSVFAFVAGASLLCVVADTLAQNVVSSPTPNDRQGQAVAPWPTTFEGVQNSLVTLEGEERQLVRARAVAAERVAALHQRQLLNGRHYARLARVGLLPLGGGLERLSEHAAQLQRLRRALSRDYSLEQGLERRRIDMAQKLEILRARKAPLEAQRETIERMRAAGVASQERALAFERAFSTDPNAEHAAVYSAGIGPAEAVEFGGGFSALKGRLPFPVPGRSEISQVLRRGAGGTGLQMLVARGSAVRATSLGRVGFAASYADYGKTVILDHGGGYFTVSANLDVISVSLGDEVTAGSRIGTVGTEGGVGKLYFEIRKDGQVVEPADWFGL